MENFKPKKPKKEVISIRIDHEILEKIDNSAIYINISRYEFKIKYGDIHIDELNNLKKF